MGHGGASFWPPGVGQGHFIGQPRERPLVAFHNGMLAATLYFGLERVFVIPSGQ